MAASAASHLYTTTAVQRWSCESKPIPSVDQIKSIHVFDFDNTLFATPLPNELIWNANSINRLKATDYFVKGGWWHNPGILAATGGGVDEEEKRGYAGWWNEQVVHAARQSIATKDDLTVLLTGRSEAEFPDLILRILKSKKLNFDLVCLKPSVTPTNVTITTTMQFKIELLKSLVFTYSKAPSIKVWEDRPHHVKRFNQLFYSLSQDIKFKRVPVPRGPLNYQVITVTEVAASLDELTEICQIQRMINDNNIAIRNGTAPPTARPLKLRKEVVYTAYVAMLEEDRTRLNTLIPTKHLKTVVSWPPTVLIQRGIAPGPLRSYIGEVGTTIKLRVHTLTTYKNEIWAVRVDPIPGSHGFQAFGKSPMMVLACLRGRSAFDAAPINRHQGWTDTPLQYPFEVEATIAERILLDIAPELPPPQKPVASQEPPHKKQRFNNEEPSTATGRSGVASIVQTHQADFISLDAGAEAPGYGHSTHSRTSHQNDNRAPQSISANTGPSRGGRGGMRDHGPGRHNDRRNANQRGRGGGRGGGGGRGRGGRQHQYRSLDDVQVQRSRAHAGGAGAGYRDYDAIGGMNGQRDFDY